MIIDESGLCRALKRAHKTHGYTYLDTGDSIVLYSEGWFVRCQNDLFPRKALATVVEHFGFIPKKGEAMSIQKQEDPQLVIREMLVEEMAYYLNGEPVGKATWAPIQVQQAQIYQQEDNKRCYAVLSTSRDIVDSAIAKGKAFQILSGNVLRLEEQGELVAFHGKRPSDLGLTNDWLKNLWGILESIQLYEVSQ